MKRTVLLTVVLFHHLLSATSLANENDGAALSACLLAVYEEAHSQTPSPKLRTIYVIPNGEKSVAEVQKSRLSHELPGLDWPSADSALDNLYARTSQSWSPPSNIYLPNISVQVRALPKSRYWYNAAFFVSFWPPGYNAEQDSSIILGAFGPSDHGSRVACQLRKHSERWSVENKWIISYL